VKKYVPVDRIEDLAQDLAGRHRRTSSAGDRVDDAVVDADLAQLARGGYVILPNLITPEECAEVRRAVQPLLGERGRNAFEGVETRRVYSVMAKTRAVDRLVDHPRVLALLDRLLDPNYLLSQLQVIDVDAGERAQLEHFDDAMYPIPRPRPALSAATVWAIDDFTPDNGATVVLPRSHQWDNRRRPADSDERRPAVMPAGSCVFFLGTLWHGGGANTTARSRLAVTAQYCQPWLRTHEAFALSTPLDIVSRLSPDLQRMLGYSIHPPFLGAVNGMHPLRLLDADGARSQA
jgi:Phytanoyl-CoA dioxygenase (PhyH)